MYKTVLFDFDGTLFDTSEGILKSVQYSARAFGYQADDLGALHSFIGPPLGVSFKRTYGVDDGTASAMVDKFRERYAPIGVTEVAPYPGIEGLLRRLRAAGIAVCVATGKPTRFAKQILARFGMDVLLDSVIGSPEDSMEDVKARVIAEQLAMFGAENAVMVGDRDNDVLGAKANALPCIGVRWGFASPGELESAGAIAVAENVEELEKLLLG